MELSRAEKLELAQKHDTKGDTLVELAMDDDNVVRFLTAKNFSTPAEGLLVLAGEREIVEIPIAVARHFKARFKGVFWKLVDHPHYAVRMELAGNPYVSISIMWKLAKDPEWLVRREVAVHATQRHVKILKFLARDECEFVRKAAMRNIHFSQ